MKHKTRWMAICLATGLCAGTAGATTIDTGTDWTQWNIVANSKMGVTLPTSNPWTTAGGFAFNTPDGNVSNMPGSFGSAASGLTTNDGEIDMTMLPGGETAMEFNLGLWDGQTTLLKGGTVDVKLDGQTFSSIPYGLFWFSSSAPITTVAVLSSTAGDEPFINAISYAISSLPRDSSGTGGNPSPVPEPATILLVSAGALILFGARRRWFRREA